VAIKIYKKYKLSDNDRESVDLEIQILKQLDHPNIIKLIDIFEDDKYLFLVIELMEGGELNDIISERLKEEDAKELIRLLIDAIRYCH
jgi:serine/threonine protein kinase